MSKFEPGDKVVQIADKNSRIGRVYAYYEATGTAYVIWAFGEAAVPHLDSTLAFYFSEEPLAPPSVNVCDMPATTTGIDATLEQRGTKYGDFNEHAHITQAIKAAMRDSPNWAKLPPQMKEAMEMVAHKFGRILNGDPNFHDSWHDCIGYLRLVEKDLKPEAHDVVG